MYVLMCVYVRVCVVRVVRVVIMLTNNVILGCATELCICVRCVYVRVCNVCVCVCVCVRVCGCVKIQACYYCR